MHRALWVAHRFRKRQAPGAMVNGPINQFHFDVPSIVSVGKYSELQRAVMPVVGYADGRVEPFATGFCISSPLGLIVTAWHVVDQFMQARSAGLRPGQVHIAMVYETDDRLAGADFDLGGPLPVRQVLHLPGSDLALLTLWSVESSGVSVAPASVGGISFRCPPSGDWCYGFGYPVLKGGEVLTEQNRSVVDFERELHCTGGRVIEPFPRGQDGHIMVSGPSFHCDAPVPFGMSGGPVLTDATGICGVMSSAFEPNGDGVPWASYVTLMSPLLEFPIQGVDDKGADVIATIRELATDGYIDAIGELPPQSDSRQDVLIHTFDRPRMSS